MGWGGVCYDGKDGSCYEPGGLYIYNIFGRSCRSSLHNFGALTMIFIIINYHNSLLIIIDHNNVKIEKLLRMLLM